ncbi:MAG: trypsin-like peptidase domain-containing protein [Clostridia bacterium]|nr:trypsin-like peptidase domain-containing protein [Clostridia bacterium]
MFPLNENERDQTGLPVDSGSNIPEVAPSPVDAPSVEPSASAEAVKPSDTAAGAPTDSTAPLNAPAAPIAPPKSEYEVSYDSVSGRYTYSYTDPQAEVKLQRKKNRVPLFICIAALVLVISTLMGLMGGALMAGGGNPPAVTTNPGNHVPVITNTVVNVNNSPISENDLSKAAAAAVNSVVVIDTFASESAVQSNTASGAGSGVIWTADGYIVTCNHVIDGFSIIRVTLADGTSYFAEVVGTDVRTDLAVLRIQATKLPAITARGSDLVLAETVLAIGNPLGVLSNTVSRGILSCLARAITIEGQTMTLIQIDASVNHGNSGGGLFDANGSLIGIVNAKSTGDSVEGIGFAIPINTVLEVCNQLIEKGYVNGRPRLGVEVVAVNPSNSSYIFNEEYYPKLKEYATTTYRDIWGRERTQIVPGVYINDASRVAGYAEGSDELKFGDRVLYVGTTEISSLADVQSALSSYSAGDTIEVTIQRNQSKTIVLNIILGQQGA